jgi:hypothetical protein
MHAAPTLFTEQTLDELVRRENSDNEINRNKYNEHLSCK